MKKFSTLLIIIIGLGLCLANLQAYALGTTIIRPKIKTFNSLKISGDWNVVVNKGDNYNVTLIVPGNVINRLDVYKKGSILHIGLKSGGFSLFSSSYSNLKAIITMPKLRSVHCSGDTKIKLSNFAGDKFNLKVSGDSYVFGANNVFKTFTVKGSGDSKINFNKSKITNANIFISGDGSVLLNMDGGALMGRLSGAATIKYTGGTSNVNGETSGAARISKQ